MPAQRARQVLPSRPAAVPQLRGTSFCLFLHLGSFLVLAPRRRHPPSPPPAEPSRQPSLSARPHPGGSCPFKRHLPPAPPLPLASGWGRRRRRPARPPAPPPPPGPALLQVRPGICLQARGPVQGVPAAASSPGIQALTFPAAGCPCSLPRTACSPVPPLSSAPGIRRLLTPLRHPLPGTPPIPAPISPPPRLPLQKALPRSGFRLLFSGTSAFPRHPNPGVGGGGITATPTPLLVVRGVAGSDARYRRRPSCSAHPSSSAKSHLKLFLRSLGSDPSTAS